VKPHLRTLPVTLAPDEVAQRATELARELHDQAVAEEAAASTKKKLAKDLEERRERISRLGRVVHTQREDRQIDCHEEHSALDGTARTVRDDTGEVVDTRPLTQEELRDARQEALPGFRVGSSAKEWTVEPADIERMEKGREARKARAAKKTEGA
jgi:hypothetical protein